MVRLLIMLFFVWFISMNGQSQSTELEISTNFGKMKFRLFDDTPKHRDAFIELAKEGYYNETLFIELSKIF